MAIDDKPAARWTEGDLTELCEQHRLDTRDEKLEAERDAHGIANSGGGHIVYGIAEADLADGATAASHLTPLTDGSSYERLNNVLDSRGEPRLPFDIHSLVATDGGSYLVVEAFGHRRPHRCSNGRYYVRRNLLVREMTEAEVAEAYRERFTRQATALGVPERQVNAGRSEEARRQRQELLTREFGLYRAETGADSDPGWLSVLAIPTDAEGTVIDPIRIEAAQLYEASQQRWRPEESPLTHYRLQRTTPGFYGQLPDRDDTYPRYLVRFWRNGVAEFGDLLAPAFPTEEESWQRVIPAAAIVEYAHDFLLLVQQVYRLVGYEGTVEAEARLENVAGYRLAVSPGRDLPNLRPIQEDVLAPDPWRGSVNQLDEGAAAVAHDLADLAFLAAGAGRPYLFQDGKLNRSGFHAGCFI